MATATSTDAVVLDRTQRDGLHEFVLGRLTVAGDSLRYAEPSDPAGARALVTSAQMVLTLLDRLGWSAEGAEESYAIEVDPTMTPLFAEIREDIEGTVRYTEEHDESAERIAHDRAALEAIELLEAAAADGVTSVVVEDEPTRRVLEAVLWYRLGNVDSGNEEAMDLSQTLIGQPGDPLEYEEVVDRAIALRGSLRAGIDRLRALPLGERFSLPLSPSEVARALDQWVIPSVEEDPGFWSRPAGERDLMLASRDAATALQSTLEGEEVAR